jgi:hypothetical protein
VLVVRWIQLIGFIAPMGLCDISERAFINARALTYPFGG